MLVVGALVDRKEAFTDGAEVEVVVMEKLAKSKESGKFYIFQEWLVQDPLKASVDPSRRHAQPVLSVCDVVEVMRPSLRPTDGDGAEVQTKEG